MQVKCASIHPSQESDLPPPPFPPRISEPDFTNFIASYFSVKVSVTPTAKPILSSLIAYITTILPFSILDPNQLK